MADVKGPEQCKDATYKHDDSRELPIPKPGDVIEGKSTYKVCLLFK